MVRKQNTSCGTFSYKTVTKYVSENNALNLRHRSKPENEAGKLVFCKQQMEIRVIHVSLTTFQNLSCFP